MQRKLFLPPPLFDEDVAEVSHCGLCDMNKDMFMSKYEAWGVEGKCMDS